MSIRLKRISNFLKSNNLIKEAALIDNISGGGAPDLDSPPGAEYMSPEQNSFRKGSDGSKENVIGKIKLVTINHGSKSEKIVPSLKENGGICVMIYLNGDNPFNNVKLKQLIERLSIEARNEPFDPYLMGGPMSWTGLFAIRGEWRRGVLTFEEKDIRPYYEKSLHPDHMYDERPPAERERFREQVAQETDLYNDWLMNQGSANLGVYPKQNIDDAMDAIQKLEQIIPGPLLREVKRQVARKLGLGRF